MRVRKTLVGIAAGAILAVSGAAYSAPLQDYYRQEQQARRLIRQGEQLERRGYWRQGQEMERRGRQLLKEAQRHERFGRWEEHH
jgi:hypothetical protein